MKRQDKRPARPGPAVSPAPGPLARSGTTPDNLISGPADSNHRRFLKTDDIDRRAISHDLYDTVGQSLVALKLSIYRVERSLIQEIESASAETKAITDRVIEQLRTISDSLLPITLDDFGLRQTLEDLFKRYQESSSVKVEFTSDGLDERLPIEIEAGIYRIVRETLLNLVSNLHGGNIKAIIAVRGTCIRLNIQVTGGGVEACSNEGAETVIYEMASLLGGSASIKMLPGKLRLTAELPVPERNTANAK